MSPTFWLTAPAPKEIIEPYTCKLELKCICHYRTASINIVLSATRGSIEDVNTAMQRAVDVLREAFPPTEEQK